MSARTGLWIILGVLASVALALAAAGPSPPIVLNVNPVDGTVQRNQVFQTNMHTYDVDTEQNSGGDDYPIRSYSGKV